MKEEDIFTSVIRIRGSRKYNVVPVKSSKPINKNIWLDMSKVLSRIYVSLPIEKGELICKNIMNTGIDIISTKTLLKDE